ncbi:MAG: HAMP domain-containing sensor histidine kinase [Reinekea sp.]|jgi:K+-sensing histidine kinase KdpD|nr:HAMP domain-containing sensor histidine kinase [Reinekea sp.]MDX1475552.1 HAMP domain-containing sensor histidine kinase [Reinekea sp.]
MDMQTIMASTVHDVKNSLGLINSQLNDVFRQLQKTDPESAQEIRRIQLECGRINNGMVHMLGLYKLHKGTFLPAIEEVYVPDVINDAVSRYSELFDSLGIALTVHFDDEECMWYMDANLIEGLLGNVLTNAIRYTKTMLRFDIGEREGWLNIRMTDDGDGYPEKMLNLLDQPDSVCFQSGATGLGLFFCQKIAEMHSNGEKKGYIQLTNDPQSKGAVFDLFLP